MKYLGNTQSGSLGGTTASRNRNGQYMRRRAVPVQPRTPNQSLIRSQFADAAAAWRGLSAAVQAAWISFAAMMSSTDALGQAQTPTGFQQFVSSTMLQLKAGLAALVTAPAKFAFAPNLTTGVTSAAGVVTVTGTGPVPAGVALFVEASGPQSAGRTFNGQYKLVKVLAPAAAMPSIITPSYAALYGAPPAGTKIFMRTYQVTAGQSDLPALFSCIAT